MTPERDSPSLAPPDAAEPSRRRARARPTPTPPPRPSIWAFLRRALLLWVSMARLTTLGLASRFKGGDKLDFELRRAKLLRAELERLGGVFIKVGQLLSVRTDQFPWEVCKEFGNLLDYVIPFPGEVAAKIVVDELDAPLDELFSYFDPQPIAAASIGQVHVAWLRAENLKVAVKIQRPGVAAQTRIDLTLMKIFARVVDTFSVASSQRLTPMILELERIMEEELSYINEARSTYDFRRTLKGRKHIESPRVYFEYTTDRVLTLEFMEGLSASVLIKAIESGDQEALTRFEAMGIDRRKLARRFYGAVLEQAFEHSICHVDPHPGNLIILPGNKVCFIDFGAVGYFGPTFRQQMERISAAMATGDVEASIEATLASWEPLPLRDIDRFKADLKPIYQRMLSNATSKHGDPAYKSSGRMFLAAARVAAKHGIQAPWDQLRFTRLVWEYDSTVVMLDPEFNFRKGAQRYFEERGRRALKANLSMKRIKSFAGGMVNLMASVPQDMMEVRYQMFNLLRRSDRLYVRSMSKMSYAGKVFLEYLMVSTIAAVALLVYFRLELGRDEINRWLGEHLPIPFEWWVWALILGYTTIKLQQIRHRVSDVE